MAAPRFCESCGSELIAGARFCEACGAAVRQGAPAERAAAAAVAPAQAPGRPAQPVAVVRPAPPPHLPPPARRSSVGPMLAVGALTMVAAAAVWYLAQPSPPPQAGGVPQATEREQQAPAPAEQPPAHAPVTRADLEGLKAAASAAFRADVQAIFARRDSSPELQADLNRAVAALGRALYQHHAEGGHGDLATARAEMRTFLESLTEGGLGVSEPAIEEGVASVAP